jgi:phytoene/squalene synthetase
MRTVYCGILDRIEAEPTIVLRRRVSLSAPRKLWIALSALPIRLASRLLRAGIHGVR